MFSWSFSFGNFVARLASLVSLIDKMWEENRFCWILAAVSMINRWPPRLRTTLASSGHLSRPGGDPHDRITVGALSCGGPAFAQTNNGFSLVL